jgi:hypothetical protein
MCAAPIPSFRLVTDLEKLYSERAARFSRDADALAARSRLVSNLRGLAFGLFSVPGVMALFDKAPSLTGPLAGAGALMFALLVAWHARVIEAEEDARRWARVNRDALARVTGRWHELLEDGKRFIDAAHPYAEDVDLFGKGSLYQRVSVAHTRFGQDALARYLSAPASLADIERRQQAVRAFAPPLDERQRLEANALAAAEPSGSRRGSPVAAPDPDPLLRWAESEPVLSRKPLLIWAARILPFVTLAGAVAAAGFGAPTYTWALPLIVQIMVGFSAREPTARTFTAVSSTEGAFLRYGAMLEVLEQLEARSPLLEELRARVTASGGGSASRAMRDFRSGVGWFDLRHNGLVHPFANALLLWDIHCTVRLERWQERHGNAARSWFVALGELEALSSLSGLAHDEPDFCFPEVADGAAVFVAEALGHPLIPPAARVPNDVSLPGPGTALLVTGSNMSGKSTLLRAMGLAAVMALAGGPVCARKLRTARFAVGTSIRISDSLARGVSHFYAELNKLKAVVDASGGSAPLLFLLDEILHGTNSRERQIGARWVLAELLERGATGAVSTHDMALCRLSDQLMARVTQVHFRESVANGKMTFDYKLRPGPVTEGNALRLMRTLGLEVPLD